MIHNVRNKFKTYFYILIPIIEDQKAESNAAVLLTLQIRFN